MHGKGLGVFAEAPISEGTIVWRHLPGVFELYDAQTFSQLIAGMSAEEIRFELTHVHAFEEFPECLIRARDDGIRINHSSKPNLATNKRQASKSMLDSTATNYLQQVADALANDRYSLIAIRDIAVGEELVNNYNDDDEGPAFYERLCDGYAVTEDYLETEPKLHE